ncbi:hAT family dimerization domain-containing protein, partial [Klebsiella pneumoniae]
DVLAIQVSTVASESAFSAGGRVIDPYRSRLDPEIVEALICTKDWVAARKGYFYCYSNLYFVIVQGTLMYYVPIFMNFR